MKKLCALVTLAIAVVSTQLFADASARWKSPGSDTQPLARSVLERSNIVADLLELINNNFKNTDQLKIDQLTIVLNNEGAPTADTSSHEISLPYNYIVQAISAHAELEETREAALKRAIDTVEYTLYHLWAHVVADDLSPDSDDTAEALSSWLMIKGWPNGGEQWFEDAQAFGRASQLLDGSLQDYWHAHSLYKSRQKTINCWILGSNPKQHEPLFKAVLDPAQRRQQCTAAWQELDHSMKTLLRPMLKVKSPLLD